MNKISNALAHWFAIRLRRIAALLEQIGLSDVLQSKFVDLAPTDKADKAGVYSEAIHFAISNARVKNIALTGPYGSGKSSIVRSYLTKYRPKALHISLAAFVPENDEVGNKVTRQEIERSILQQMLYGADANRLPLSRFKRIQAPGVGAIFVSLYILVGVLSFWYVFQERENIISGTFFDPFDRSNWLNLGSLLIAFVFIWTALHHFYVASFGLTLKSISLKDAEIRPAADDQESILNRHLDEIVYFFQSTEYDLVVIEDLDRFNDTEIFTTLREINSLVNENAGVKRIIRFLYALRDDMFVNTDRTKFFEFIIPVIPIINSSNSIDMVLEQGRRLDLDDRLDRQFLREVSRYLNDLRLIQNIFNEYAIYVANLETDEENLRDANKLLAILIYKNVYPRDFEQLHRGSGSLAEILSRKDELIAHGESFCRAEIVELEEEIEAAESQIPTDLKELRQIYGMALIEMLPDQSLGVITDGRALIPFNKLAEFDSFEQLIEKPHIVCRMRNNQDVRQDISSLQSRVDSQKTYQQRKAEVESKASESRKKSLRRLRDIRSKIEDLRTTKLNELVRMNSERVEGLFEGFGKNGELARFLILEGHLDDTYYQYTSLFHSGRLSPSDNKFLIQIRAYVTPEPSFPIDNPQEVIAAMRDDDFRQSYALNIKIVDCLLGDRNEYAEQLRRLVKFISSEFEACESFLDAYYGSGIHVARLVSELADAWTDFVPTAISSPKKISHITQLIGGLSESSLKTLAVNHVELTEFVTANLLEILNNTPELSPQRLECLQVEVKDLDEINEHSTIVHFMYENGHFDLSVPNLEYIYGSILGEDDLKPLRQKNYTSIRATNNSVLIKRVERDFELYLTDVLLELPENSEEDAMAILDVVRRETLDQGDVREFLEMQSTHLPSLSDVPATLHTTLLELGAIEPTWRNGLAFIESKGFEKERLIEYLERDDVRAAILAEPVPSDPDSKKLRRFLIEASSLSGSAYRDYAQALPMQFQVFPEDFQPDKVRILIEEDVVTFSEKSLAALADHRDLQVLFVGTNIDEYLGKPEAYAFDDSFREELIQSKIDDAAKRRIVDLMDLNSLAGNPVRSALVGSIIESSTVDVPDLDGQSARSLVLHSKPVSTQISLFNRLHSRMSDEEVRDVLVNLPRPFSEIKTGYFSPRLKNTPENVDLATWLDSRNIISSWSQGGLLSDDIKVNLRRS